MVPERTTKSVDEVKAPQPGAIAIGPFGSRMKSENYVASGVPVIRGTNIGDTRNFVGEMVYITDDFADNLGNAVVRAGDLVFPHRGSIGQVGIVPSDDNTRYVLSTSLMKLTCDPKQVDPFYLFYFFRSQEGRHELLKNASTVGTPGIGQPLSSLRSIRFPCPPLSEQKAIARILGTLDDKIELNRRMNATLEAMARALFQSWFVDFDPVHAKAAGRKPSGMDAATAAMFPSSFENTAAGEIPEGWEVTKFGDFIERLSVGQKYDQKTVSAVGRVPVLDQGKSGVIGFHNNEPGVAATHDNPVAVFANHTCYMRLITHSFSAIQNVLPFIGSGVDSYWAYYATEGRLHFSEYKGHWPDFVIQEAIQPPRELTEAFGGVAKLFIAQIGINEEQCRTLTTLRDKMLPKLLSGELNVADFTIKVEHA